MEIDGGIQVYDKCKNTNGPNIEVYQLQDAGHLLMLDNWQGFHAGVVAMCGGTSTLSPHFILPKRIRAAAV
jgi:hypothetical protein